jgi:hypothetical protein
MRMICFVFIRILLIMYTLLMATNAWASSDAIGCIKEITMPGYQGRLSAAYFPLKVEVIIDINDNGKARHVRYSSPIVGLSDELNDYFIQKANYSTACAGRTISFFVTFEVQSSPEIPTEVRFSPPDRITIVARRPVPALDPVRSGDIKIINK